MRYRFRDPLSSEAFESLRESLMSGLAVFPDAYTRRDVGDVAAAVQVGVAIPSWATWSASRHFDPVSVLDHSCAGFGTGSAWRSGGGEPGVKALFERPRRPVEDELKAVRAAEELSALERERVVLRASEEGRSQRWIAEKLGCSQTEVFRILRRARANATIEACSVRELLLRLAVGEVSRGTVVGLLTGLDEGRGAPDSLVDGYLRGGLDEVRVAWLDGLIDDELYEEISAHSSEKILGKHTRDRRSS